MATELSIVPVPPAPADRALADAREQARDYMRRARAANTVRGYDADWRHFCTWCGERSLQALPAAPDTVAAYLSILAASRKPATLTRRISAISQAHQLAGHQSPADAAPVKLVMAGIRRAKGTAPNAKAPALTDDIRGMISATPDSLLGVRDRALLLAGFMGAFRRSELVGLDWGDCTFTREGVVIHLRRSKTDQDGLGRKVAIPAGANPATCAVQALQAWREAAGTDSGPIFRPVDRHGHILGNRLSAYAVAFVVKRYAGAAGLDPTRFAGHSLRAGLATAAAIAGASERSIMAQTGHKSVGMVRRYIRDGNLFRDNAAARLDW
jgi:integrase